MQILQEQKSAGRVAELGLGAPGGGLVAALPGCGLQRDLGKQLRVPGGGLAAAMPSWGSALPG